MRRVRVQGFVIALLAATATAVAQGGDGMPPQPGGVSAHSAGASPAVAKAPAKPRCSDGARAALAAVREIADRARDLDGAEELAALQAAAKAYDQVAAEFAAEPMAAAQAAFAGAEYWRRHGSAEPAERDYLAAARLDPERYGQRAAIGAADMQRQLERDADALASYAAAVAIDPASTRAQAARLWQGRMLVRLERFDEALAVFRAAVAAAKTAQQVIEASNVLARALVDRSDFDGAAKAIEHADAAVAAAAAADPLQQERLHKALDGMSARRALQRARDRKANAVGDAQKLEGSQRTDGDR